MKCPKCDFERQIGVGECPSCGIIYDKYEEKKQTLKVDSKTSELQNKRLQEAERIAKEQIERKKIAELERKKAAREKIKKLLFNKITMPIAIAVLLFVALGWFVHHQKQLTAQKKQLTEQLELKRKQDEKRQKTIDYFKTNRSKVINQLKSLIDQKKLALAEKELTTYDLPEISPYLTDIKKYFSEMKLYEEAKKIPASEHEKNYKTYAKLYQLNPEKRLYQKKSDYYKSKFAEQKYQDANKYLIEKERTLSNWESAFNAIDTAVRLDKSQKKYQTLKKKLHVAGLLFYKGNDNVEMAVRDDGVKNGKRNLFIWIKNISSKPIYLSPDNFTLLAKNKKSYTYLDFSKALIKKIHPNADASGWLIFNTSSGLKEIIFSHMSVGKISREFP